MIIPAIAEAHEPAAGCSSDGEDRCVHRVVEVPDFFDVPGREVVDSLEHDDVGGFGGVRVGFAGCDVRMHFRGENGGEVRAVGLRDHDAVVGWGALAGDRL